MWWQSAVVYQIYPRSFADSDGDGIGDLRGIASKLDYLSELGVDVLWLSPVYPSPQDDNGYDISDYQDIDPVFGTLADFDALLEAVHARGMKLVMDLVVNHTSRRAPVVRRVALEPRQPEARLVLVARAAEQLALVLLRADVGPRRDDRRVLPAPVLAQAAGPQLGEPRGAAGDLLDDALVARPRGRRLPHGRHQHDLQGHGAARRRRPATGSPYYISGPRIHEFVQEMHREVFAGRDGELLTVGEMPSVTLEDAQLFTDPARGELDMVFGFEHVGLDHGASKWDVHPLRLRDLKQSFGRWQDGLAETGWNSLYWNNHDQPRIVSRFGDDGEHRVRAAKMLGTVLHLHRGTPYVYQGEELGMTNFPFASIDDFRDIESLRHYAEAGDEALPALRAASRDNARTPMQWDDSPHAGFTTGEPWLAVNPNFEEINAEAARADPDSVFHHYRALIALRHTEPAVALGSFSMLLEDDERVYAFTRRLDDVELLVLGNFSGERVTVAARGLGRRRGRGAASPADGLRSRRGRAAPTGGALLAVIGQPAAAAGLLEQLGRDLDHQPEGGDDQHEADERRHARGHDQAHERSERAGASTAPRDRTLLRDGARHPDPRGHDPARAAAQAGGPDRLERRGEGVPGRRRRDRQRRAGGAPRPAAARRRRGRRGRRGPARGWLSRSNGSGAGLGRALELQLLWVGRSASLNAPRAARSTDSTERNAPPPPYPAAVSGAGLTTAAQRRSTLPRHGASPSRPSPSPSPSPLPPVPTSSPLKGAPAAGPARYDKVFVERFGPRKAKRVLVLVPGFYGGAGDFALIGPELARACARAAGVGRRPALAGARGHEGLRRRRPGGGAARTTSAAAGSPRCRAPTSRSCASGGSRSRSGTCGAWCSGRGAAGAR